jgi:predicted acylesterase/phospholipase RssA
MATKPKHLLSPYVLFLPFLILVPCACAEEAVVLSGGGSLGLVHAGALVGMEQRGRDPNLVVGTSMGAIVGALYAAGYDPDSIWTIMERADWREIFTPIPVTVGPIRTPRYAAIQLQRGGGGLILRGFVSDRRINRELVRRLFPASARVRGDFDRLPRRFRSVTADLEHGALVPIGSGDLARSVRASMAAPGFFSPIRWGGRILVDGGVNDYLPVDEARRLGADFVIAVDALRLPRIRSLDAILVADRSLRILVRRSRLAGSRPDILVRPDLNPALTPFVYPVDPTPLLKAGLDAALRDVGPRATRARRGSARPLPPEPASLGSCAVEAPGSPLAPFVGRAFRRFQRTHYDPDRLLGTIDRLYATGSFDGIWPSVEDSTETDTPAWIVRAESESRFSASGAVGFDDDRGGRIWAMLRGIDVLSATPLQLGLEGSTNGIERSAALSLRVLSLGPPTAWSAGGIVGETEVPHLTGEAATPEVHRAGGWVGIEWLRLQPSLEGAAVFRGERITSDVGPDGASFGPFVRIGAIPRLVEVIGTAPSAEGEARFGDVKYRRARVKGSIDRSMGPIAVAVLADGEAADGEIPPDIAPSMGAEYLVPALRWGERRGKARAVAGIDLAYSLPLEGMVRMRLRGGIVADEIRTDASFGRGHTWLGGAGLTGLWWTLYGRVEAGVEAGTLGDRRVVVRLGLDF